MVNERGYVDGVKAAKKNSKGVVLGKAVEYIKRVSISYIINWMIADRKSELSNVGNRA